MFMIRSIIFSLGTLYLFVACSPSLMDNEVSKIIKTTVFSVEGSDTYQIDTVQYIEKEYFDHRDVKLEHQFLNPDGTLKGKEIYEFNAGSKYAKSSTYTDNQGNPLSYYKFLYDANGNRISSHGHDAANDELLRIERYQYDDKGNRTIKEIRDASDVLNRSFQFTYDEEGNIKSMTVLSSEGKILLREDYKIIGRDKKTNVWVEMWGFRGTIPNSCKLREFIQP